MAIYKCKMCGGDLDVAENATVAECEYCGSKQTVPTAKDEELASLFNRANILRRKCEFDKAEQLYEKILVKDDKQSEAYWGVLLCRYGIEYVEDPATSKRFPTCHRTAFEAITSDEYYKSALQYADPVQKAIYEQEAKYIDGVQKDILALSQQEDPYDVFICYKETDNGKRTQDSVIANDIYYQLTSEGFKVFYAAITLENKLGSAYEPIIFAALNSAKVMLAIGTKPEYFNAVWVKNEWSRYLKMMKSDKSKQLIPCYRDMDAYELPEEFAHLQAQDMSKIGFISDIVRGIKKIVRKEEPKAESRSSESIGGGSLKNLLKRAYLDLESRNFDSARVQFDKMQDIDPENGEVYLIGLLCDLRLSRPEDLEECSDSFTSNNNWRNLDRYADSTLKARMDKLLQLNENWRMYCSATQKFDLLNDDKIYEDTKNQLAALGDYRDSKDLLEFLPDVRDKVLAMDIEKIIKENNDYNEYDDSYATLHESEYKMLLAEKKVYESDLKLHGTSNWWDATKEARLSELQKLIEEDENHKAGHENYDPLENCKKAKQLLAKILNDEIRTQCGKLLKESIKSVIKRSNDKIPEDEKQIEIINEEIQKLKTESDFCSKNKEKVRNGRVAVTIGNPLVVISMLLLVWGGLSALLDWGGKFLLIIGGIAFVPGIIMFVLGRVLYKDIRKKYPNITASSLDTIISDNGKKCSQDAAQISDLEFDIENQKNNISAYEKMLDELEQEYPEE